MSNTIKVLIAAVGVIGVGVVVWFFAVSGAAPTTDVTAPPIQTTAPPTTEPHGDPTTTMSASAEARTFELTAESTATFEIDEELRGQPNRVVATSDQVVGQIRVDLADLGATEVGAVLVNARAFETDSTLRDRAISGPILDANQFEFIEFVPTAIEGLSGAAEVGATYEFTVTGDLTIRDQTREATFEVTATLVSEDRIEGVAEATVLRSDFGLQIPSVPSVANVSDEVALTLTFIAQPA